MKTRHPPLLPLQESDRDPRAVFAATLLSRLKSPPSLPLSASARIELQLRRGVSRSSGLEISWALRSVRRVALVVGILIALCGSAFATYRAPEMARAIRRYLSQTTELWEARSKGLAAHRPREPVESDPQAVAGSSIPSMLSPPIVSMPRPLIASGASAPRSHPLSHAGRAPSPTTAARQSDGLALGVSELEHGLAQKRAGNLAQADEIFRGYRAAHPDGPLAMEAALDQLDSALALGRQSEALELLDTLSQDRASPRASELRLLRAEVQARLGQCDRALATFSESYPTSDLNERALYGHASCLQRLGRLDESRRAFTEMLTRFPDGALTTQARQVLGKLQ